VSSTNEAYLTKKVSDLLKQYRLELKPGFYYHKVSDRYTSGIPDFYVLYRGFSAHIELKAAGKSVASDGLQSHTLDKLKSAGAYCIWSDDFSEVSEFLRDLTSLRAI